MGGPGHFRSMANDMATFDDPGAWSYAPPDPTFEEPAFAQRHDFRVKHESSQMEYVTDLRYTGPGM